MDAELAVSSVSTDSWETEAINEGVVGKESYRYRYSVWIEALGLSALIYKAFSTQYIKYCSVDWFSCINMSFNDAVLYVVAFFKLH